VVATLTLALGIGATTGVVSILDAVLLRALPYRDSASLAMIVEKSDKGNTRAPSYLTYKDYADAAGGPVAGLAFVRGRLTLLRRGGGAERVITAFVTPGFFPLMGTVAYRGRTFATDEERAGTNRVAVLSWEMWQRKFGGDTTAVGRTIDLDSVPTTIIGVMPRGFAYPDFAQAWEPIAHIETTDVALRNRATHVDSRAVVRLRSARDSAAAAAALALVQRRQAEVYPDAAAHWTGVALWPMRDQVIGNVTRTLVTLAVAAALVLLLACANVATLSLVRGSVRAREVAVRAALGATRGRLVSELLAESGVIAIAGGAVGVFLAIGIMSAVRRAVGGQLPRSGELVVDGRVLLIATAVSLLAALVAGLVPAYRVTRLALSEQLHGGHRGSSEGRRDARARGALVATQFALTIVLLVSAGLLLQSFRRLHALPDEYDRERLVTVSIFPPSPAYDRAADAVALYDRLRDAVRAVSGVQDAAVINHMAGIIPSRVDIPGLPIDNSERSDVLYHVVSSEYQRVIGMPMARGRWFTEEDMRAPDASGFVVNETMASRFFPQGNAVGRVITLHRASQMRADVGQPISGPIIGVVHDIHWWGGRSEPVQPEAFVPYTRETWPWVTLVARATNPAAVAKGIRKAVFSVDPNIPVSEENAFDGVQYPTGRPDFGRRELTLAMIGAFGISALLLAAIGLYGVVAYGVTQRTRELGVRIALGATRAHIARLILGGVGRLVAIGGAAGLAGAFAATRLIRTMLFDTAPTDPATYVLVPVLLAAVALAASWWPTRRAMRVEPTIAIRAD
jgi:predicted permease